MENKSELIELLYLEALKQKPGSEEFLNPARSISKFYTETFGMDEIWQNYITGIRNNDENEILDTFSQMKIALIKLNKI